MDLRWIFLFHGVETCVETCVETVVDLRWKFLRTFSSVKPTFSEAFFSPLFHASFHRYVTASFHRYFTASFHRLFSPLFHDTLRSLFHELGDYGVGDNAVRARAPEIYTKELHLSLTLRRLVWSCSAEFFCS